MVRGFGWPRLVSKPIWRIGSQFFFYEIFPQNCENVDDLDEQTLWILESRDDK